MIVNLWSTPRTGSNWYVQYLLKKYTSDKTPLLFHQFLNYFHLINYYKSGYTDFVYEYDSRCSYVYYSFDKHKESITIQRKAEKRKLDSNMEEAYRLELLDKHNYKKHPCIFYNHVAPMNEKAYTKLFSMTDKNIFLYRKDIKRQLSSYALGYGTKQYKPNSLEKVYNNISVDYQIIKNLADRIQYWHSLDKNNCEIVCYEDLDFGTYGDLPKKQNLVDPFLQLDQHTQEYIIELSNNIKPTL